MRSRSALRRSAARQGDRERPEACKEDGGGAGQMSVEIHHFTFVISSPAFEIPHTWILCRDLPQSTFLDRLWGKNTKSGGPV
jgi:hypothetical protein